MLKGPAGNFQRTLKLNDEQSFDGVHLAFNRSKWCRLKSNIFSQVSPLFCADVANYFTKVWDELHKHAFIKKIEKKIAVVGHQAVVMTAWNEKHCVNA